MKELDNIVFANFTQVFVNVDSWQNTVQAHIVVITGLLMWRIVIKEDEVKCRQLSCPTSYKPSQLSWERENINTFEELKELVTIKRLLE